MTLRQMNYIVASELPRWPRGPRGSDQNMFRFAYSVYRMSSLSRKPMIACSAAAAMGAALRIVRRMPPASRPRSPSRSRKKDSQLSVKHSFRTGAVLPWHGHMETGSRAADRRAARALQDQLGC